ncbi:MAG TPA: TlpA disulfide reductase family protein [Verrucomicrobiae bacterium]|nr:TlpA disulfide reductase family protein [Verrucomicrobiae bacterium]
MPIWYLYDMGSSRKSASAPSRVRALGALIALCAAFAFGLGVVRALRHHTWPPLAIGDRLPPITLRTLGGEDVQLGAAGNNRTIVYNVFATWCGPCNQEAPQITRAASILSRRGVAFVGIDQGESADRIESFAAANGLRFPLLIDSRRITTSRLNARIIPETLVVQDGIVRHIIVGPTTTTQLLAAVEAP